MLRKTLSGFSAGILITIGGTVFLSCDNRYIGAVLFSVALLCICLKKYSLFTGKIGMIPEHHSKEDFSVLLFGLLGNILATACGGLLIRYALKLENAAEICTKKLAQPMGSAFIRAVFCGILMYLAVSIFSEKENIVGILFCIPVFILSGFEHSIADMFYFSAAGIFSAKSVLYLTLIVAGNSVGGMLLPVISKIGKAEENHG
ncbi:MAG: formate/nitrite transporter family protein [Clostridia bacterium]|nr:formate/nitrite transporter family protein [Clostridia bacterium]